jgi:YHS domain-containing protein
VKDPVTEKELDNLKAQYRYEYKGRNYFFESEASEEKFRTSPETYIGDVQSRYERVQGYQEK